MPSTSSKDWTEYRRRQRAKRAAPSGPAFTYTEVDARADLRAQQKRDLQNELRQQSFDSFVAEHSLVCFVHGGNDREWAKTGTSKRGPWAICVECAKRPYVKKTPAAKDRVTVLPDALVEKPRQRKRAKVREIRLERSRTRSRLAAENDALHDQQQHTRQQREKKQHRSS